LTFTFYWIPLALEKWTPIILWNCFKQTLFFAKEEKRKLMQDKNEQPSVYLRAYKSETETLLDVLSAY
jgi:hypothetical protein